MKKRLDVDEFVFLSRYIFESVRDSQPDVQLSDITSRLFAFDSIFDLSAMTRFIGYARKNGVAEDLILATIVHDLNGMHDPCFLPRTSAY